MLENRPEYVILDSNAVQRMRCMEKSHILYTTGKPGAKSILFKKAAQKNAEIMRALTVRGQRELRRKFSDIRPIPPNTRTKLEVVGGVPCEWVTRGDSRTDKIIVYLHGGCWSYGDLDTSRSVGVLLSELSERSVLVVEYRLAPEFPFPAALTDCKKVYNALLGYGYKPQNIAFFGDSAGGNLALCLMHVLLSDNTPLPAALALASPVTNTAEDSNLLKRAPDLLFAHLASGGEIDIVTQYAGRNDRTMPALSPVYGELSAFPPMLIHVGEDEPLCVDNIAFADRAAAQGAQVICKIWKEMYHDFTIVGITLKESRLSLRELVDFIESPGAVSQSSLT